MILICSWTTLRRRPWCFNVVTPLDYDVMLFEYDDPSSLQIVTLKRHAGGFAESLSMPQPPHVQTAGVQCNLLTIYILVSLK